MLKILMLLLLTVAPAQAEIYRWTDGRGTVHYTNSEYEIPDKYRNRAVVLNLGLPVPVNTAPAASLGGAPQPEVKVLPASPLPASVAPSQRSRRRASRGEE
jgi:Domain of unknown function (DUF4124)